MNPATAMASVLVDQLVCQGVREAVLSPGSRNAPLSFALHAADAAGRLRLHVRIDERTAGFLALGMAKAGHGPVAVVTTSGTATANLHPAVLEAHHSGLPLVVLTADRPPELRATGANQATDQVGLYGEAVRFFADVPAGEARVGQVRYWRNVVSRALAAAEGRRTMMPGPVHLNLAFRDPLVPDGDAEWVEPLDALNGSSTIGPGGPSVRLSADGTDLSSAPGAVSLSRGPRTVVVAGDDPRGYDGWRARRLAEAGGWPLLAEPSSGARSGPNALGPYRLLLEHEPLVRDVERVVAFGRPTLSRPVTRLLSRPDVELVVVAPTGDWVDPGRTASLVVPAVRVEDGIVAPPDVGAVADSRGAEPDLWLRRWLDADAVARDAVDAVLDETVFGSGVALVGPVIARTVAAHLAAGDLLVVGSSNPIRDLDLAAAPFDHPLAGDLPAADGRRDLAAQVRVLANRGLSGIDGTVSTVVGAALAHGGPAYALMGDLTFLHDATGLVIGPDEPRPDLCIVVVNDDGGGIFGMLEQGGPEHAASFERVFGTRHGVDLAALCAATGTSHMRVESVDELREELKPRQGIRVVEAQVGRRTQRDLHARFRAAVAAALEAATRG